MSPDRLFLTADIAQLVESLKPDEKISLLGAPNWWNTNAVDRLHIPAIRMSDGPNGVRGSSHFISTPAQCLPCATSLAATFNPALIHKVGEFLAEEAKVKSSVVLLAPTCNIQRSPLGGRAFESFSEDPHLSGVMASAYVKGLQSKNVSAAIKHFVANDQEHERTAANSDLSDRALREIYLYPFMLAQKNAQPWAYMTSYGRIGNVHCSENPFLLQNILRGEWKFEGIIMSDWYGTYGVDGAINAGLDLEMPGPARWRTQVLVNHALSCQKLLMPTIDERVTAMLTFIQHQARRNPEVVYGDGVERSRDSAEARQFCRELASEGIVLLKNDAALLPLTENKVKRVAIIGPNARERVISGGGSAALKATYVVTPSDGITAAAYEGLIIEHDLGCYAHKYLPTLETNLVTPDGKPGWLCTFYNNDDDTNPIAEFLVNDTRLKLNDFIPAGLGDIWTMKLVGKLSFYRTGAYDMGLTVAGRAKLFINGKLAIDNWTKQTPGDFFYGQGTVEEKTTIEMVSGEPVDVLVVYTNLPPAGDEVSSQPALMRGVRLGGCLKVDPDEAIVSAVNLAKQCDAVIFVAGLTPEWESEGFDRPTLHLPGRQDETITRIGEANPNTVVVIQAGSAIAMPWLAKVNGVVQSWYLGNESGNAIADVLFGKVNPSGKLPLTLPAKLEDIPAYPNLRSENGQIHYREDLLVGYKHYAAHGIKPLFAFGHGRSYTSFTLSNISVGNIVFGNSNISVQVSATLKNTGSLSGSEVVQLYVSYPDQGITHPPLQLRGFSKASNLKPGESKNIGITLDKYAFSFWDTPKKAWKVTPGKYSLLVGFSSDDIIGTKIVELEKGFSWNGL